MCEEIRKLKCKGAEMPKQLEQINNQQVDGTGGRAARRVIHH